jgi:TonB family protein
MTIGHNLTISASTSFSGHAPTIVPDQLTLTFRGTFATWRFLDHREVLLLLDDTSRVTLCDPSHNGFVLSGYVVESMVCTVSTDVIRRVASAAKVEGRVGGENIALRPYETAALANFLDALEENSVPDGSAAAGYLAFEVDTAAAIDYMHDPKPRYPSSLRKAKVTGSVIAEFLVGTDGKPVPESIGVLANDNAAFTAPAVDVIPKLRFTPAVKDGKRVAQWVRREFVFFPQMGGF